MNVCFDMVLPYHHCLCPLDLGPCLALAPAPDHALVHVLVHVLDHDRGPVHGLAPVPFPYPAPSLWLDILDRILEFAQVQVQERSWRNFLVLRMMSAQQQVVEVLSYVQDRKMEMRPQELMMLGDSTLEGEVTDGESVFVLAGVADERVGVGVDCVVMANDRATTMRAHNAKAAYWNDCRVLEVQESLR